MQCKGLPMCLTKNNHKMIQPVTNETVNKSQQFPRSHSVPKTSSANFTMSSQLVSPFGHECLTKNTHTMIQSVTRNKYVHKLSAMLCSAPTWHQTCQPALPSHPITSPIASVHATLHLLLSTIPSVCLDGIYDFNNTYHTFIYI